MRKSILYPLLALCFLTGLLAGWMLRPWFPQSTSKQTGTPVTKPDSRWHLDQISVSPDGTLAVIRWQKTLPPDKNEQIGRDEFRVALYELPGGRRLSDAEPVWYPDLRPGYIAWSPSGKFFACQATDNNLLVFKRDGTHFLIDEKEDLYTFVWMPEKPDTLFMPLGAVNSERHLTYQAPTGNKTVETGQVYQSLFPVNGRTCGATIASLSKELVVYEVLTGKVILRIPTYTYAKMDGPESLMVSPDGKYFQLSMYASGYAFNLVARTSDAARVLRDEHLAIHWLDNVSGVNNFSRILWPVTRAGRDSLDSIMQHNVFLGSKAIDSRTGSDLWLYTQMTDELHSIDYWYGRQDYLLVKPEGLFSARKLIDYTKEPAGPILPSTMTDEALLQ